MDPTFSHESHATRASLLLRLKSEESAREMAWSEFEHRYAPMIAGFARKMGARPHDVGDLVQDVLLGFYAAQPRFSYDPSKGRFRGYLKTCTWRALRDRFGKSMQMNGRPLDAIDPADHAVEAAWNDVWETEKLQRAKEIVRERYVADAARAKTYRAFEMYVLQEQPAEQVAAELGLSVDSVHQARHRIIKALREVMEEIEASA